MTDLRKDSFTVIVPKDSRKRLPIPRATYSYLMLEPGKTVRVTIEELEIDKKVS
jgi:hypothetical protein